MTTRFFSLFFLSIVIVNVTSADGIMFEVIDSEENCVIGTITDLDQTQVIVDIQGTSKTIPLTKLTKIRNLAVNPYNNESPVRPLYQQPKQYRPPQGSPEQKLAKILTEKRRSQEKTTQKTFPNSVISIGLKDGTQLTASSLIVTNNQATFRLLDWETDSLISLNKIAAIRFSVRGLSEVTQPPADWVRLAVPNTEGDRLIVNSSGAFDAYNGILNGITAETVSFVVDGETQPVPRRKVYGLVLHDEPAPAVSPPLALLILWSGTKAAVTDIRLQENELIWQMSSGLTGSTPLDALDEIDFGEKNVFYLTDLEPIQADHSSPIESPLKLLQAFNANQMKKLSPKILLDGMTYEHGMTLIGKTTLEYQLPKPFASLKAVIGIEDQFRPYSSASIQILADSQVLVSRQLRGDLPSEQIQMNLPQNCRLLTITVEPSAGTNVPAILTIADPKLL